MSIIHTVRAKLKKKKNVQTLLFPPSMKNNKTIILKRHYAVSYVEENMPVKLNVSWLV